MYIVEVKWCGEQWNVDCERKAQDYIYLSDLSHLNNLIQDTRCFVLRE